MVRFSQTLGDRQSKNREKPYEQISNNQHYYSEEKRNPYQVRMDDRMYSQPPRPVYQQKPAYQEDNFYRPPQREEPDEIIYERQSIEREFRTILN